MPRINILNLSERETFESPPIFNSVERRRYFTFTQQLYDAMNNLVTPTNKICFLVTAGYFKARHKFFARQFYQIDIEFVAKQIGVEIEDVQPDTYSKVRYLHHQTLILNHFGFTPFDSAAREFTKTEVAQLVKVQFRAKLVLLETVQLLTRRRITTPSYNVLATIIASAINNHQNELSMIIDSSLNQAQKEMLDGLLEKVTGSGSDDKWRYQITLLKRPSKSTAPANINANVADLRALLSLYLEFVPVLTKLGLSHACLRFYASSVVKLQIHQVVRRKDSRRYLHLIAFVACQTLKLQDMLIDTLLLAVQSAKNFTEKENKNNYYLEREVRDKSVNRLVDTIQKELLDTISTIKNILVNLELNPEQKLKAIDATLNQPEPTPSVENQVAELRNEISKVQQSDDYYDLLEERSLKLQNRVANIVRYTTFDPICGNVHLYSAIKYYQEKLGNIDKNAPTNFLQPEDRRAVFSETGKFRVSLYKALLYINIAHAIKPGVLNMVYSEKYRSLDDYMIPKELWTKNRNEYLQRAELSQYADCHATLKFLDEILYARYEETNSNFIKGDNPFLTFRANGTFHVTTPKIDDNDSLPLSSIFPERKFIPLLEALATVDNDTGFLDEFQHWQTKFQLEKPAKKTFFAGIMAYGCDIDYHKLAQTSKQINEDELGNTLNWYFSLANIQAANDRILQCMDKLELPNIYRNELLHTSSDGQKFGVSVDSLNANYAFKYLGKDKGVSVMTFIDMRQMMWYSTVVSPVEREAAYVIDPRKIS